MTVEEAEKILGIERNMSYEEVLRVRTALSGVLYPGMVVAVSEKCLVLFSQFYSCATLCAVLYNPPGPL